MKKFNTVLNRFIPTKYFVEKVHESGSAQFWRKFDAVLAEWVLPAIVVFAFVAFLAHL